MTAYNIARQLDDALPPGTVVRETPLGVRDDYTSLAWLAGQIALKDIGRPADAARMFRAYGDAARSAQTRTKGYYWAGRAEDRKSVVSGKSVSVRVDLGGRRILTKKNQTNNITKIKSKQN